MQKYYIQEHMSNKTFKVAFPTSFLIVTTTNLNWIFRYVSCFVYIHTYIYIYIVNSNICTYNNK